MNEKYEYAKAISALAALERERVNLATRCEELEQLCRDMWLHLAVATTDKPYIVPLPDDTRNEYCDRMKDLKLLEGEEE